MISLIIDIYKCPGSLTLYKYTLFGIAPLLPCRGPEVNLPISPSVHHSLSSVLCPTCCAHSLIWPVTSEPGYNSRVCPKAPSLLISLQPRLHFNWQLDLAEFRTGHQGSFSTHAGPTPGGVRQGQSPEKPGAD